MTAQTVFNVLAVIGGVVGGLILLFLIFVLWCLCRISTECDILLEDDSYYDSVLNATVHRYGTPTSDTCAGRRHSCEPPN